MENVELRFTDGALKAIAKKAIERKTGARGLRSILENLLLDTMYELPDIDNLEEVVVEETTVENNKDPKFVYAEKDSKKKKSKSKKEDKEDEAASA